MAKITIDKDKCKGCLLCISFCPKGLIKLSEKLNKRGANYVEFFRKAQKVAGGIPPLAGKGTDECLACCQCAIICPDCCIEVYR